MLQNSKVATRFLRSLEINLNLEVRVGGDSINLFGLEIDLISINSAQYRRLVDVLLASVLESEGLLETLINQNCESRLWSLTNHLDVFDLSFSPGHVHWP